MKIPKMESEQSFLSNNSIYTHHKQKPKRNTMNVISCFTKLFFDTNGQLNSRCLISKQWLMPTEHGKQMIE